MLSTLARKLIKIAEEMGFPFHFGNTLKDKLTAVYVFEYLLSQARRRPLVHETGQPGHVDRKANLIKHFEEELTSYLAEAREPVAQAIRAWWEKEPEYWYAQDPIPEMERGLKLLATVKHPFQFLFSIMGYQLSELVPSAVTFCFSKMPKSACPSFNKMYGQYMQKYGNPTYAYDGEFEEFLVSDAGYDRPKLNKLVACVWSKFLWKYLQKHGTRNDEWNEKKMNILDTAEKIFKILETPSGSLSEQVKDFNIALNLVHNNGPMIEKIERYVGEYGLKDVLYFLSKGSSFVPKCDQYLKSLGFDLLEDEGTQPMYRKEEEGRWLPAKRKRLTVQF